MLTELRDKSGRPNLRAKLIAALVVFGLVLVTAPVVLVPLLRAIWNFILF